eukprot:scaffold182304_cov36-Cyclotella_meneghiniana.AAC.1
MSHPFTRRLKFRWTAGCVPNPPRSWPGLPLPPCKGVIMSTDTLPYELDLCQLIDTRKKKWKKALLPKFGGNAH